MSFLDVLIELSLCVLGQCQYKLEDQESVCERPVTLMNTNFYVASTTLLEQHIVYSAFFTIRLCRN